ncbi:SMI1/KNR4 family protein [Streptomyces sp. NPDC056653]|uniref:SMI1/KNR4 family protein n=1 Tax=Streptomyces sp. NPDC056653 TaxID=3345894 RepID=UPI0036A1B33D
MSAEETTLVWEAFETELARVAPLSHSMLRPPASEEEIVSAEEELGVAFPAGLRALYLRHDGVHEPEHFADYPHDVPPDPAAPFWRYQNAVCFLPGNLAWLSLERAVELGEHVSMYADPDDPRRCVPFLSQVTDSDMSGMWVDAQGEMGTWTDAGTLDPSGCTVADYLADGARALATGTACRVTEGEAPFLSPSGDGLGWVSMNEPDVVEDHLQDGWRAV